VLKEKVVPSYIRIMIVSENKLIIRTVKEACTKKFALFPFTKFIITFGTSNKKPKIPVSTNNWINSL
jgi:hypothetical protein